MDAAPIAPVANESTSATKSKAPQGDVPRKGKKGKEPKPDNLQQAERKPPQGRPGGERPRRNSVAFTAFYRANLVDTGLIDGGAEWEAFTDCLNRPLPCSLWITPTAKDADEVRTMLQEYQGIASKIQPEIVGDEEDAAIADSTEQSTLPYLAPLVWMPNDMGWRVDVPKRILRKDTQFKPLHEMLIEHTAKGTINRMEEVSMLPVAVLGVGAGHRCLDMCASPGNKTAQMLSLLAEANYKKWGRGLEDISCSEILNCQPFLKGRIDYSADEGFVIANDISSERCGMLVHQISRHQSLYPLALFTSHDARFFPSIKSSGGEEIMFDRILCDVMCSSDGTLRKSPHLWREWSPKLSLELHCDQLSVALRAARLLKIGGRMVYSTCSMSPVENEAVVAELLRCTHGGLELVDARKAIEPLRTCEGLREWKVANPTSRQMFSSYAEALEANAGHKLLRPGHFPPALDSGVSLALPKCIRILPHHNDTSGFFIAVFEKIGTTKHDPVSNHVSCEGAQSQDALRAYDSDVDVDGEEAERERQLKRLEDAVKSGASEQERAKAESRRERAKKSGSLARELARYKFVSDDMPNLATCLTTFYGAHPRFPTQLLVCRHQLDWNAEGMQVLSHQDESNQLFLFAGGSANVLRCGTGEHARRKLKIMAGGLRAFQKDRFEVAEGETKFRFAQEALELLLPYIGSRMVDLEDAADTRRLMLDKMRNAPTAALVSPGKGRLEALSPGGCILLLCTEQGDRIPVSALRTQNAVNLYTNDLVVPALRKACGLPMQVVDEAPLESEFAPDSRVQAD